MGKGCGKNQHSKDRMFVTATEHKYLYGGKHDKKVAAYQRLPFDHCALSFTPFESPACTADGVVFDLLNLLPYLKKHRKHPITGDAMEAKDIVHLHFSKNADGRYFCPVTYKEFNDNSHIVAVRTSGNVFSYEAVEQLNIKAKSWKDLLSGEPFRRSDLLVLNDPKNVEARAVSKFEHLHRAFKAEEARKHASEGGAANIRADTSTSRIFETIAAQRKEQAQVRKVAAAEAAAANAGPGGRKRKRELGAFTRGGCSGSFTSTMLAPETANALQDASPAELLARRHAGIKARGRKGYVRLHTTKGDINVEIDADIVPRCADNFLGLCRKGYYDGVAFHRVIANFMAQGGDPTGTGRGGESLWGSDPFACEFDSRLTHDKRGMLSMANSGRDTNRSQFFITLKSCKHLDYKHSVFGRVVGGADALAALEQVETGEANKPLVPVTINRVTIFQDPIVEYEEALVAEDLAAVAEEKATEEAARKKRALAAAAAVPHDDKVGKYMVKSGAGAAPAAARAAPAAAAARAGVASAPASSGSHSGAGAAAAAAAGSVRNFASKKKAPAKTTFGNFSGW